VVTGEDEVRVTVGMQWRNSNPAFRLRKDLSREYDVIEAEHGYKAGLLKLNIDIVPPLLFL